MKRWFSIVGIVVFFATSNSLTAREPNFDLTLPRISPPVIDGDPTDLAWTDASRKGCKIVIDLSETGKTRSYYPRIAYLGYDREYLYACFIVFSPDPQKLKSGSKKFPWHGDDIELYLQTDRMKRDEYVQIIFTPNADIGVFSLDKKERTTEGIKISVKREDIRWCLETAIPYQFLGVAPPKAGATWFGNLCGRQMADGSSWLAWNTPYGGFQNTYRFAKFIFGP